MSPHTNPKLAAIDDALTELDPILEEFGLAHGFILRRSHEGSYNVPRRWLHRDSGAIFYEIGLIISSEMPERLERGFYPEMPCTLYLAAFDRKAQRYYDTRVFEAQPFSSLRDSLRRHLADALAKLDACTPDYILRYGVLDHAV
jgi:hypothetical protein